MPENDSYCMVLGIILSAYFYLNYPLLWLKIFFLILWIFNSWKKIEEAVYKWKSESLGGRPLASPLFYTNNWVSGRGPHEACSPFWTHSSILQGASLAADCLNDSSGVHSSTAPQRKPHLIWPGLAVAQAPVQPVDGNILSHFHFLAFRAIWGHLLFAY